MNRNYGNCTLYTECKKTDHLITQIGFYDNYYHCNNSVSKNCKITRILYIYYELKQYADDVQAVMETKSSYKTAIFPR